MHVPIGGDLKLIVMLSLTGECTVVVLDPELIGGGYCAIECAKHSIKTKRVISALDRAPGIP